ncbi:MAG: hypothetical protein KF861_07085 [Planctomycetaceae bacterium]|nr:hypothetical protein [Planctomycetaceae bacterium]
MLKLTTYFDLEEATVEQLREGLRTALNESQNALQRVQDLVDEIDESPRRAASILRSMTQDLRQWAESALEESHHLEADHFLPQPELAASN